jgi:hypothetical protein
MYIAERYQLLKEAYPVFRLDKSPHKRVMLLIKTYKFTIL